MKKIILIVLLIFTLTGCKSTPEVPKTEAERVAESNLFQSAISMNETFTINDISAKVVSATTNLTFIGNNRNIGMMGVHIYIDYPQSVILNSSEFKVVDLDNLEYSAVSADGLDFLGANRGENNNELGYYRVSLPDKYSNFLLKFSDNGDIKYVHFIVESGE